MRRQKVYIRGLVRVANTVRRELTSPVSTQRRAEIRALVTDSLQQVERILQQGGATVDSLPAPTRRAYEFLAGLDLDAIASEAAGESSLEGRGNVSLVGLKSFWEGVLGTLAQPLTAEKADDLYGSVRSASDNIENHMDSQDLATDDLTAQSRAARGWLAFFSDRENFDAYLAAVGCARSAFNAAIKSAGRFRAPAIVEFRPTSGLYRLRGYRNGTRVVLATPMISFTESEFGVLAQVVVGGGDKQVVVEATLTDQYQAIQAELESLSGVQERTAGIHHDLAASFARVVKEYFDGTIPRPRLTWSTVFTSRKFGHYDPIRDTVMVSCTLDHQDVPEYVLDFVMYHELLHKKLGVDWRNGCRAVHTPEFRREERRFAQYAAAEAALGELAKRHS